MSRGAALSPEEFAGLCAVSRETVARLSLYLDLLLRWQRTINLVGRETLFDPWRRHMLDSGQLMRYLPPEARSVVDLGSGAGFPGLVLAILGAPEVHLVEADQRKAQFLREAARITGAHVDIHAARVETLAGFPADVVTARALAPLPRLLGLAERFLGQASVCLFLKGRKLEDELALARRDWHLVPEKFISLSDPEGSVLKLVEVARAP